MKSAGGGQQWTVQTAYPLEGLAGPEADDTLSRPVRRYTPYAKTWYLIDMYGRFRRINPRKQLGRRGTGFSRKFDGRVMSATRSPPASLLSDALSSMLCLEGENGLSSITREIVISRLANVRRVLTRCEV